MCDAAGILRGVAVAILAVHSSGKVGDNRKEAKLTSVTKNL